MKAYIVINFLGVFALNEKGDIIHQTLFPKNEKKIAKKIATKELLEEEKQLIEILKKKGYTDIISSKPNDKYEFEPNNLGERRLRRQFRSLIERLKIDNIQLNQFLTNVGIELTKINIKSNVKKDRIVMEVIDAIDEIDKSLNIFMARLREWYGLHFPEIGRLIDKHEKYVKIVSQYGLRENITEKEILPLIKESMGIELDENDEAVLKEYSTNILNLYKLREQMEKYLEKILKEIMPNFTALAGPLLAARLITLAGGADKLAKKPSSTIQLLGAEKALFRYLHGRGRSPRHGIIYMHPMIQQAPEKSRGRIARILASRFSIAIRMDYYGKEDKSEEMRTDLKERIKQTSTEKS
jgi:nucleolar protein 56